MRLRPEIETVDAAYARQSSNREGLNGLAYALPKPLELLLVEWRLHRFAIVATAYSFTHVEQARTTRAMPW